MTIGTIQTKVPRSLAAVKGGSTELVSNNMDLVEILVRQLAKTLRRGADLDDLRQAGFVGLIEAAGIFDSGRGIQFATFASNRVRGAMVDELRSRLWAPRSMSRRLRGIAEATRHLEQEAGRRVTLAEIARALDTTVCDLDRTRSNAVCASLQSLDASDCDDRVSVRIVGSNSSPVEILEKIEFRTEFAAAIATLHPQAKKVIALRYSKGSTQTEISEQLDVTSSRICQIEAGAIAQLRSELGVRSRRAPTSNPNVRRAVTTHLPTGPLPQLAARSDGLRHCGRAAFAPASGMRYLLETMPKAISRRSSLKRALVSTRSNASLRVG